ncbi:hypothetical protein [Natronobeatus ordinarius]|uniref:hypothetical protein n=1 Tax=Natronobeatus ordinarius TaxID=2963433 RepID=UPI0020CDBB71|nr:hypothetical protein [Natronobeatus ordinarius]
MTDRDATVVVGEPPTVTRALAATAGKPATAATRALAATAGKPATTATDAPALHTFPRRSDRSTDCYPRRGNRSVHGR